jgi:hypothetical protein
MTERRVLLDLRGHPNRDNITVSPFESELAECMIGSSEYELLRESEGSLYNTFLPGHMQAVTVSQEATWEEIKSTIQRESFGPVSPTGISAEELENRVYVLAREAMARVIGLDKLKGASKAQILASYAKVREVEDSADRLLRIILTAGTNDADVKLDVASVTNASYAAPSLAEGETIHEVLSTFIDVTEFPQIETVNDVVRHRAEPYIVEMREAIFEWAEAVAVGDLREESDLRKEIQTRVNKAGRKMGRSRACRMSLSAIKWASRGVAAVAGAAGLAHVGVVSGFASFAANLGEEVASRWERRLSQKHRWLLHGRES